MLGPPLTAGADAYHPGGRASTRLVVVDVANGSTRAYDVPGNVEPEAFGVGLPALFVIDHRPAKSPNYYRVASMGLDTGQVEPLLGPDKFPLSEDMSGTAREQVYAASGRQLYTLYAQPRDADLPGARVRLERGVRARPRPRRELGVLRRPAGVVRPRVGALGGHHARSRRRVALRGRHAAGKLAVLDTGALDRNHLINDQPRIKVVKLPRAVPRNAAIALTTTATGIALDTATAHFTYDPLTTNWRQ